MATLIILKKKLAAKNVFSINTFGYVKTVEPKMVKWFEQKADDDEDNKVLENKISKVKDVISNLII